MTIAGPGDNRMRVLRCIGYAHVVPIADPNVTSLLVVAVLLVKSS